MKERKTYTSVDQLPLTLTANQVASVLSISRANAYSLMHSKGFPTIRIGKRMVVHLPFASVRWVHCLSAMIPRSLFMFIRSPPIVPYLGRFQYTTALCRCQHIFGTELDKL